jgi:hypothetical protein
MMIKLLHFFDYHNYLDQDRRPLSENFTMAQTDAQISFIRCPYKGKRFGKLMNNSALVQYARNKDLAKVYLSFASQLISSTSGGRLLELWQTSISAKWLVHYLIMLNEDYVPDSALAVVYKMARGVYDLTMHMILAGNDPWHKFSINKYIEFLHDKDLLIGRTLVCAAPEALIESIIKDMLCVTHVHNFGHRVPFYEQIDSESYKDYLNKMFRLELICGLMAINQQSCTTAIPLLNTNIFKSLEQIALFYGQVTPFGDYLQIKDVKTLSTALKLGIKKQNLDLLGKDYKELNLLLHLEAKMFEEFGPR